MRKMLGIFTIAVAAFFLIAVSASAAPTSHHHHHGGNGNWGGGQGGQCGNQGDHFGLGDQGGCQGGGQGGQCGNQDDHFGLGDQGGCQGGQCGNQGDYSGLGGQGGDQGGCQGGGQGGGQCGNQSDHQSNGEGDNGGQCQCNQGDYSGQGDQGGDQGNCHGGNSGGGGSDPTSPPVQLPNVPSSTFLCYSTFEVNPAVYTFGSAWHWLTSTSDHYFTPDAVKGNVPDGTNVGGFHLICNAGLLGDKAGTPTTYADSDGDTFGQAAADAMASDYGSYNGMTLNVFPIVG